MIRGQRDKRNVIDNQYANLIDKQNDELTIKKKKETNVILRHDKTAC